MTGPQLIRELAAALTGLILAFYVAAGPGWRQVLQLCRLDYAMGSYLSWLNQVWIKEWWLWLPPCRERRLPARHKGRAYRLLILICLLTLGLSLLATALAFRAGSWLLALLLCLLLVLLTPCLLVLAYWLLTPVEQGAALLRRRAARDWQRLMTGWTLVGLADYPGGHLATRVMAELLSGERQVWCDAQGRATPRSVGRFLRLGLPAADGALLCDLGPAGSLAPPRVAVLCSAAAIPELSPGEQEFGRPVADCLAAMAQDSLVVVNGDDAALKPLIEACACPVVSCGFALHNQIRAGDLHLDGTGSSFTLHLDGESWALRSPLLGQQHVVAVLMAAAVCRYLGGSVPRLLSQLDILRPEPGHLQLSPAGGYTLIHDGAPGRLQRLPYALDALSLFACQRRVIVAAGPSPDRAGEVDLPALGQRIAGACQLIILVDAERSMALREGAIRAGFPMEKLFLAEDQAMAALLFRDFVREGDAVLISVDSWQEAAEDGAGALPGPEDNDTENGEVKTSDE